MRPVAKLSRLVSVLLLISFPAILSFSQENEAFEGPEHARKRAEEFWKLRGIKPGTNAARLRLRALAHRDKIRARDLAARAQASVNYGTSLTSVPWISIGPTAVLEGGVPNAGRVDALALDPSNENIVYAGTAGGGV